MTYLITFSCYGGHLHGNESGSVDRGHNLPGSRMIPPDPHRQLAERRRLDQPAYALDAPRRNIVLDSLCDRCREQRWRLLAAHVRTSHVHLVVESDASAERLMNDVKSYGSRCLNRAGLDDVARKRWTRHGSTRWLWTPDSASAAIRYVVDGQGEPMAVFEAEG